MKIRLKKRLSKYKNKIFSFIAVVVCIPFLSVNIFAFDFFYNTVTTDFMQMRLESNVALNSGNVAPNDDYYYNFSNNSATDVRFLNTIFLATWDVMFDNVNYDYYVSLIVDSQSDDNFTFRPNRVNVRRLNDDGSYNDYRMQDFHLYEYDGWNTGGSSNGYRILAKFPDDFGFSVRGFSMLTDSLGSLPSDINVSVVIIQTSKDTTSDTVNSIVQAINNQTSTLGGKIDDTNDFIDKGNSSTGGIVSNNNSAIDNLDEVISEYRATEESFFNDFNSNQQAITSDIVGWSWGGLVDCANWVGNTLTSYYNNMGDFRQYIIYPLMLGIALFFLGRGGSIIGHLFRKPSETTVNTKSVFRREGNTRYSTTTTWRQGGVFRK